MQYYATDLFHGFLVEFTQLVGVLKVTQQLEADGTSFLVVGEVMFAFYLQLCSVL